MKKGDEESFVIVAIRFCCHFDSVRLASLAQDRLREKSLAFDMLQNTNGKGFLASLEMTSETL